MRNQPNKGRPRRRRGGSNRRQQPQRRRKSAPRINWKDVLDESVWDLRGRLVEIRRDFHRYPELAFEEKRTAGVIAEYLGDLGLEVQEGVAGTGVIGILHGDLPGPTIMFRADMDALPVEEKQKGDYTSRNKGVSHVCGHDGHMAIALGIATHLSDHAEDLPGTIKFIFQPAEEGGAGAKKMIQDGALEDPEVEAAFGLHLSTSVPTGRVAMSDGPVMAASADFTIRLSGKGGHAAAPHLCSDPILAASHLISALQSIPSRTVDPTSEVILSIGTIQGGTQSNIIPREVTLTGTVRTFDEHLQKEVLQRVEQMAKGIAEGFGLQSHMERAKGYPATSNDPGVTKRVREILADVLPDLKIEPLKIMGSEDMSYFLEEVPGCYFMLGCRNDAKGCNAPHHSPEFDIDEDALPIGVQLGVRILKDYLEGLTEEGEYEDEEAGEDEDRASSRGSSSRKEVDFLRTRSRRRRRGGNRDRREAVLPEADAAENSTDDREETADTAEDRGKDRRRSRSRRDGRKDRRGREAEPEPVESQDEEEHEQEAPEWLATDDSAEEESRVESEDTVDSPEEFEAESEDSAEAEEAVAQDPSDEEVERTSLQAKQMDMARGTSSLEEGDLTPLHRKRQAQEEPAEEEKDSGKSKGFGAAPWLWKGKRGRR